MLESVNEAPAPERGSSDCVPEASARTVKPRRIGPQGRRALGLLAESGLVGIAGGVIAAVVVGWDPSLWRVYFSYGGDTFFNAMNGALANPLGVTDTTTRVGWPHGLSMTDFPAGEPIFTWFQWFAHRFVGDDFTVLAAVWFLGFVLVPATAYLVLRSLGMSRWPSVIAALVYDFVPFHIWRGFGHTNLAMYMAVPLAGMVLLWVMSGRLDRPARSALDWRPIWRNPDWWAVGASTLVIAISARYYAAFFLMLLVLVGGGRMLVRRRLRLGIGPALILALTIGLSLLTGLPQILRVSDSGRNAEVAQRSRFESDLYGLRLTDLAAPVPGHRIETLNQLSDTMRRSATRGEEGNSLGAFLLAGLVFLGGVTLVRRPRRVSRDAQEVEDNVRDPVGLATNSMILAGLSFLLGTVGGLGGVIASLGFTQIRAWNRISIYISFFGAVGLALALTWLWSLRSVTSARRWLPAVVGPLVLVLAIVDQTGTAMPEQAAAATERQSDRVFFGAMADELGQGSSVFQLPFVPFPESGSQIVDYVGFRGFFNDGGQLNWSYGGMRGRSSDWQRTWVTMKPETQVVGVTAAGFDAVMVDRAAYTLADTPEPDLTSLLGPARSTSPDGRFVWFDLRPLRDRLLAQHGRRWLQTTGARVVRPIGIQFAAETYRGTGTGAQDWGSIGASTTVELRRYDEDTDPVDVELAISVEPGNGVVVSSGTWESSQVSAGEPVEFRHEASMTDEMVPIRITTDAPNIAAITDSRPDVRGQIVVLKVTDAALAEQIERGELRVPPP